MLGGSFFYHNTTRKLVDVFGNMFNDIAIQRFDKAGNRIQNLPVPIAYGSKQKYIVKNDRADKEQERLQIMLPQMTFLMTNISFDQNRKINPINQNFYMNADKKIKVQFAQIPMRLDFELGIMARNSDDAFQIIEQIIPYFTTSFTNNVKLFPEMNLNFDIRTTFTGMQQQDDFEGGNEDTKILTWTLSFEMNAWYAGPVSTTGLIKRVQVDLHPVRDEDYYNSATQSRIVITPGLTADGQATTDPALTIPYSEINPEDPYGYITELFFYQPGVTYNPATGQDNQVGVIVDEEDDDYSEEVSTIL